MHEGDKNPAETARVARHPDALARSSKVHVGRQPAQAYRQELRQLRGVEIDEWDALRRLERLLLDARPVEVDLELEAWSATDPEHRLAILARAVRWQSHVAVLAVSVRDADAPSIAGAGWTEAALDQYASSRGYSGHGLDRAAAELTIAIALAGAVDAGGTPETWRARSGIDKLDVSLAVQRVDRAGTPLVVAAEARDLSGSRDRGRGQRRDRRR